MGGRLAQLVMECKSIAHHKLLAFQDFEKF